MTYCTGGYEVEVDVACFHPRMPIVGLWLWRSDDLPMPAAESAVSDWMLAEFTRQARGRVSDE